MENGMHKMKHQSRRLAKRGLPKEKDLYALADVTDFAVDKINHLLKVRKQIRAKSAAFLRENWKPMVGMLSLAAGTYMIVHGTKNKGLKHELKQKIH